ncbi:metal-dependent transcriptional regulator [Chloroflexota bacterium]
MELEEKAEEVLESLWIHKENRGEASVSLVELEGDDGEGIEQLIAAGYVTVEFERVKLTEKGTPLARNVVRRHRLAERLLADVMGTGDQLMHEKACKFEHLLDHGLEENICSLLGHPKICPHGKPIPPGACCRRQEKQGKQGQRVVSLLAQLNPGQVGKVAYIYAPEAEQLQRLTAMGILPGAPIVLTQNFPSYVFHVGQTQFAVDEEIANSIYVRVVNPDNN